MFFMQQLQRGDQDGGEPSQRGPGRSPGALLAPLPGARISIFGVYTIMNYVWRSN